MIMPRALVPSPDLCCLPTPHRTSYYIAGMAFNFSKIELSHYQIQRKAPSKSQEKQTPTAPNAAGA